MGVSLKDNVVVFVANEEEKQLYEQSLTGDFEVKDIVVGVIGNAAVGNFIVDYYMGQDMLLFQFDDDVSYKGTFHPPYLDNAKSPVPMDFQKYVDFAATEMKKFGLTACSFSIDGNMLWKKDAFAEIKPFLMSQVWGCFPQEHHKVPPWLKHNDDVCRTSQVLERDGAILLFHGVVVGDAGGYGKRPGGMQASGDRGEKSEATDITRVQTEEMYANVREMSKWYNQPSLTRQTGMWSVKMKTIVQLKKHLKDQVKHVIYEQPFGEADVKYYPS
jgi:hypothetical protein